MVVWRHLVCCHIFKSMAGAQSLIAQRAVLQGFVDLFEFHPAVNWTGIENHRIGYNGWI